MKPNRWVRDLEHAPLKRFSGWPDQDLARGPTGIYAIWLDDQFLYVGSSRVDSRDTTNRGAGGVWGRLATHQRGTGAGQLLEQIRHRFIYPELDATERAQLAVGAFPISARSKTFVKERISYRATTTPTGAAAREAEDIIQRLGLGQFGKPLFNAK